MLVKKKAKDKIRVTFTSPIINDCDCLYLVGDFNGWDQTAQPMKRTKESMWSLTVDLEPGQTYQYRYYTNDDIWFNDSDPDDYHANPFGSNNSVVNT